MLPRLVILLITILIVLAGLSWIIGGYMNVYAQDGHLTFWQKCDAQCRCGPPRNMYLSRVLRSFSCGDVRGLSCRTLQAKFSWHLPALALVVVLVLSTVLLLQVAAAFPGFRWQPTCVAQCIAGAGVLMLLAIPYGDGPFSKTHHSKRAHTIIAAGALTALVILPLLAGWALRAQSKELGVPLFYLTGFLIVLLISTAGSVAIIDGPSSKLRDWHTCHPAVLDLAFQLGENGLASLYLLTYVYLAYILLNGARAK